MTPSQRSKGPGLLIHDAFAASAMVNERIDSGEWWVFVGTSDALSEVEEAFYTGPASVDFEVLLGPPAGYFADVPPGERQRLLPLAFAHKRRMSAEQLHGVLAAGGAAVSVADLEARDILWIEEQDTPPEEPPA